MLVRSGRGKQARGTEVVRPTIFLLFSVLFIIVHGVLFFLSLSRDTAKRLLNSGFFTSTTQGGNVNDVVAYDVFDQ